MNCRDLREILTAYADGEATAAEASRLERHLEGCAPCRARLKEERVLKRAAAAAGAPAMPADLKAALLSEARGRRRAERRPPKFWKAPRPSRRQEMPWRLGWPAGLGLGAAFAAASALIFVRSMPEESVPVEALLAAHRQYEQTLPAAPRLSLSARLPELLAEAENDRR